MGGSPSLMSATSSYHKWTYKIVIAVTMKTAEKSEQEFLNWIKLIKQRLKSNVDLRNPTDGTDAKIKVSHPIKTETRRGMGPNNTPVAVAIITFQCEAATN